MVYCIHCGRNVCRPCQTAAEADTQDEFGFFVAEDTALRDPVFATRLAIRIAGRRFPRRFVPDWLAHVIYLCETPILWPSGAPFEINDTLVDDAFKDGSCRWLSQFTNLTRPKKRRPQERILQRLRLLDLADRIDRPAVQTRVQVDARHPIELDDIPL